MTNSIIEGLVNYFMACPLLEDGAFRVDALGDETVEYVIEVGVVSPILTTYLDGSTVRQYKFNFGSREYYSLDRVENIKNSSFYEALSDWIEKESQSGNLPELPDGCVAEKITVDAPGYMFDASMTNARYEIQLTLQYYKEA